MAGLFNKKYSSGDTVIRNMATSFSHLQLMIGFGLYFISPLIQYFFSDTAKGMEIPQKVFFAIRHIITMFLAIVVLTIGSSMAKRTVADAKRFSLMAISCTIALAMILYALPWFRPFFRSF
jgi:cell division protein FtsW (lipid II flippase)